MRNTFAFVLAISLLAIIATRGDAAQFRIAAVLPLTGSSSPGAPTTSQWLDLLQNTANNITASWNNGNSLIISTHDTQSSRVTELAIATSLGGDASVLAVLAVGLPDDAVFHMGIILNIYGVPIVSASTVHFADFVTNGSVPNFFSVVPFHRGIDATLPALFRTHAWKTAALIYDDDHHSLDRFDLGRLLPLRFDPAPSLNLHHALEDMYRTLIREGISITVVALKNLTLAAELVSRAPPLYGLYNRGSAWVVLGDPSAFPTPLPPGILILNEDVDILPSLRPQFLDLLSQLPGAYTEILDSSPQLVDGVRTLARAIHSAFTSSTVTRASILTAIKATDFEGFGGRIVFGSDGFGAFPSSNVWNTREEHADPVLTHVFDSATGVFVPTGEQMVFPGNTTQVPDSEVHIYSIIAYVAFGYEAWPDEKVNPMFDFILNAVNGYETRNFDVPVLPDGHRLRVIPTDTPWAFSELIPNVSAYLDFGAIGFMATIDSSITIMIENIISPSGTPIISTTATSPALSNKDAYPTFLRTTSPDNFQAVALLNLCKHFGWTEVGLAYGNSAFGIGISQEFQLRAPDADVRVSVITAINHESASYKDDMTVFCKANPRVIVLALGDDYHVQFVNAMKETGCTPHAVIGGDTTSYVLRFPERITGLDPNDVVGWIATIPAGGNGPVMSQFISELESLPLDNAARMAWETDPEWSVTVYDPVLVYATAITQLVHKGHDVHNMTSLLQELYQVRGTWMTGEVSFDSNGDRHGSYTIVNRYRVDGHLACGSVGPDGKVDLWDRVVWPDGTTNVPVAVLPRKLEYIHWSSPAGIVFAILAILGMLISIVMFVVMVIQRDSPIIRVATWEFLLLMLFGCALGFGSTFTWIGMPKAYICALRIWLPPIAFVLIMAPLLTKTWRLHRIFTLGSASIKPFPLSRLIVMCCIIGLVQIIICIFWISMGTIKPKIINDDIDKTIAYATCDLNLANRVCSYVTFGYLGLLMVIGCYVTFKVRKLPKDFNESRWIGFSMYNTFLFSILIIILGYALAKFRTVVLILICVCTLAICTGAVGFMLVPKLWTLIVHPEARASSSQRSASGSAPSRTKSNKGISLSKKSTSHPGNSYEM